MRGKKKSASYCFADPEQDLATVVGDRDGQEVADDLALRGPVRQPGPTFSAVSKRPLYIRPPRDAM